ncbi:MAG: hypothetical protein EBR88_08370 [Betaproteobacteria bacterium]|nr:hypothetical protein [Betaproteobacteria bacterium]
MNMKNLIPLAIFFLEACQTSPTTAQDASVEPPHSLPPIGTGPQMCGGVNPTDEVLDSTLALIKDSSRIMETCLMPAYGLYPRRGVCDSPPVTCACETCECDK